MALARTLHGNLNSVVDRLSDRVTGLLKKQESEFLKAYRSHMYGLQKELAALRQKAEDSSQHLARDERIKQLEGEH